MTAAATVEGGERQRLFTALRLADDVVGRVVEWQQAALAGGRIVPRENLHITLAFLGSTPAERRDDVVSAVRAAAEHARPPLLTVSGYRETRSVGMLTLTDDGQRAARLADDVQGRLERLGLYEREARRWLPHLTVLRFRERPRLRPELPDLEIVPSEAAVYLSVLRPSGAQYRLLHSAALGG